MDDSEETLKALEAFAKAEDKQLTEDLKEIVNSVAKTGKYRIPWDLLKPLYLHTLEVVSNDFLESLPPKTEDGINLSKLDELKKLSIALKQSFNRFTSAPFTIQRISELLINPRRHYKNSVKYFRGLEKNIMVITTIEPEPVEERPAKRPKLDDTSSSLGIRPTTPTPLQEVPTAPTNTVGAIVSTASAISESTADQLDDEDPSGETENNDEGSETTMSTDDAVTAMEEGSELSSSDNKSESSEDKTEQNGGGDQPMEESNA